MKRFAHSGLALVAFLMVLSGCNQADSEPGPVDAKDHSAFWLWAGVKPQPVLDTAKSVYILAGEVKTSGEPRLISLRSAPPRARHADIWMVVRVETLRWDQGTYAELLKTLDRWTVSSRLAGVQIDFDANTQHLGEYATFLRDLRRRIPAKYRLSITGLLDWSSNADASQLDQLGGVIDEIVVQTYQGRKTVAGYKDYMAGLGRINMPYRIGLVQGGEWAAPTSLKDDPDFKGYVVFLLNPVIAK